MLRGVAGRFAPELWALALAPVAALSILVAYQTNPIVPLALAAAAGAVVLAWAKPLWSLYLALAVVPLEQFAVPLGPIALSPMEALLLLTGVVWVVRRLAEAQPPWASSSLTVPLALLWLSAFPGFIVAEDPMAVVRFVIIWGALLLVFQLVVAEAGVEDIRTLLFVLAVVAVVVAGAAAAGVSGQEQELSSLGDVATGRAGGAFGDPNILGTFLAMALPGAVVLAMEGRWQRRPLAIVAVGAIFAGLALSLSRGGMFAAAGALLVMLAWAPMRRLVVLGVIALIAVSISNANPLGDTAQVQVVFQRVASVKFQGSAQQDQRSTIYREAPSIIRDHWLTGVGANNFANVGARYGLVEPFSGDTFAHAHNMALTIGAEFGLPGLFALFWLIIAAVRLVPRVCSRAAGRNRGIGIAVTAALVALFLQGLVDYTLSSNVIAALAAVLLASLVVLARAVPRDAESGAPARV